MKRRNNDIQHLFVQIFVFCLQYNSWMHTCILLSGKSCGVHLTEHNNHVHGTTTTTSTTPTSTATTTTTQPLLPLRCSNHKISIIESLAENIHVEDDRVAACPGTQKHQSSEALVIQKCNATTRDFWVPGPKTVCRLFLILCTNAY